MNPIVQKTINKLNISLYTELKESYLYCIIPLRVSDDRIDAIERLNFTQYDSINSEKISFIVIDDGSDYLISEEILLKCNNLGIGYIRIDSTNREFSVARCRNIGAMFSKSTYIFMQDVDLMPYKGFYEDLLAEIEVQGLESDAKKFLMIPYIFLTEEGTHEFEKTRKNKNKNKFLQYAWLNDKKYIEKVSTGTSANLYQRTWYLACGGNSWDFEGWGYEDLECNTRMIRHLNFFPTPREWQLQKFNFNSVTEYKSWKASYRLFGDMCFNKGIALFHAWHPTTSKGTYMQKAEINRQLFEQKMADFIKNKDEPAPLADINRGKSLLLKNNPFTFSKNIAPYLGEIVTTDINIISTKKSLLSFITENSINRIIFHNPYSSKEILNIYNIARDLSIPFIVCERGALPNSIFFDDTGFLYDSKKYCESLWNKPLNKDEKSLVKDYIKSFRSSTTSLELQGSLIGSGEKLKKILKIKNNEKILFIALQRPNDSVTKNFHGKLGSYEKYIELLKNLNNCTPDGWRIVYKKHPLEDDHPNFPAQYICADDYHINDLLEISDLCITYNSGVGIQAMAWNVPVLLAGGAFYENNAFNRCISSTEEVVNYMKNPFSVSTQATEKFYYHLIKRIYSFGEFTTKNVKLPDGKRMTATTNIEFYFLNFPGVPSLNFSKYKKALVSWESFLFDRYRFSEFNSEKTTKKAELVLQPIPLQNKENAKAKNTPETIEIKENIISKKISKARNNPEKFLLDSKKPLVKNYIYRIYKTIF